MLRNEYESGDSYGIKNENKLMKEGATDPLKAKHMLCNLPKISSNQVQPNGLRDCKCDEPSPYYNSSFQSTNLDSHDSISHCPQKLQHAQLPEKSVAKNLDSPRETCSAKAEAEKEQHSFVPPQGMDTGQYPRALYYQYYPNRSEVCTFDLLPLPFMDILKYQERRALSMDDEDVKEKWKEFLYKLPNSEFELPAYPDERFWRWRNYLKYAPDENKNEFKYKMQAGPKYDGVGRLPITGEDLKIFRDIKTKPKTNSKYLSKKRDGIRK